MDKGSFNVILIVPNSTLTEPSLPLTQDNYIDHTQKFLVRSIPHRKDGVGIAANQVGIQKRIFSITMGRNWKTFINPVIVQYYGNKINHVEGCLSIPGKEYEVERYSKIDVEYRDVNFDKHIETFEWLESIIIQHETDHLDGILIKTRNIGIV